MSDENTDLENTEDKVSSATSAIPTSIEFTPLNPFTIDLHQDDVKTSVGFPGFETEDSTFLGTFGAEFKETATFAKLQHLIANPNAPTPPLLVGAYSPTYYNKFYNPAPPGWNPKQEIEKLGDTIDSKYLPRLLNTKNPDDFNYTLSSIQEEGKRSAELQNGSWLAKLVGGIAGLTLGSMEMAIPGGAMVTKAKVGPAFIEGVLKNAPGTLVGTAIHEGAQEMDKMDGNLSDFVKNTFIDTAFALALFGGVGAGKYVANLSELNRLKGLNKEWLDGIGFNFKINKEGDLVGYEAIDTTGGNLSAAKVSRAQELADSAFYKGGLYKVPYVGEMAANILSGNLGHLPVIKNIPWLKQSLNYLIGSPLIQLKMAADYPEASAFADAAFDHFITTEGEAKGIVRPESFEKKVKKTRAALTWLYIQTEALRAEMNGYKITSRPAINIQNAWSAVKQKSMSALSEESSNSNYFSRDEFLDQVQRVMWSGESSEHAPVNACAALYRKMTTETVKDFLKAYNLPEDYYRNMGTYLTRVFDTAFMQENETGPNGWVPIISNYLKEADELIASKMKPIEDLKTQIKEALTPEEKLKLRNDLKFAQNNLQNELRNNPELDYHIEDRFAFSADEARELEAILKPQNDLIKKIEEQENIIASLKGKENKEAKIKETEKLNEMKRELEDIKASLYEKARFGEMNPRFYNPITHEIKDPKNRLKFREVFKSDDERKAMAKAYYDSIMHMNPEDIINDMFHMMNGTPVTNPTLRRVMPIPDHILYNNNFMTKDLFSKTANYVNFLSKKTHLKTSFNHVTVSGDFEELAAGLTARYDAKRQIINNAIDKLHNSKEGKNEAQIKEIDKQIAAEKKKFKKEAIRFNEIKTTIKRLYETRMMGINKRGDFENMARRIMMSLTAASNLHNLPAVQITDLIGWSAYQHGIWPMVRDGLYPMIESMGGLLKTKDSEAFRELAPHINLAAQDMLNNYADRQWQGEMQPYINMGKIVSGVEKYAHFSALTDLTPYIDNGAQRLNGSIIQSRFMNLLHKAVEGKLKPKDKLYLVKYGIDPDKWATRMVKAFKDANGYKSKLGGYLSMSWKWQDIEAANVFNDAVFRGIQNTLVYKGMADSPFFADHYIGMFFHTFTGWAYGATNRYLIPSLQHVDAELMVKMLWMLGVGSLVSPTRRLSRGEGPWPEDMTMAQRAYEAWQDSGVTSLMANTLAVINHMTNDKFLGNLKNDRMRNRAKTGIFGISDVINSTATRISDIMGMVNTGLDEKDLKTAAHMTAISGAMYGHYIGDKLIESWDLPRNKRAAEIQNG